MLKREARRFWITLKGLPLSCRSQARRRPKLRVEGDCRDWHTREVALEYSALEFEFLVCAVAAQGEDSETRPRFPADGREVSSGIDGVAADRERLDRAIRVGVPGCGAAGGSIQRRHVAARCPSDSVEPRSSHIDRAAVVTDR